MTDQEQVNQILPLVIPFLILLVVWTIATSKWAMQRAGDIEISLVKKLAVDLIINLAAVLTILPALVMIEYVVFFDGRARVLSQADSGNFFSWGLVNLLITIAILGSALLMSKTDVARKTVLFAAPSLAFATVAIVAFGAMNDTGWMSYPTLFSFLERMTELGGAMIFLGLFILGVLYFIDVLWF